MMESVKQQWENGLWTIRLKGKITSSNASEIEAALHPEEEVSQVLIDLSELEYISSAGLRILLRLKKKYEDLRLTEASSQIYEILEMTGFTEIMTVEKTLRRVSITGCPVIGKWANGVVYRLDPETIVKVYKSNDALPEIYRERETARKALILGIPTAISYDVVRVGEQYGSVFELLNTESLSDRIVSGRFTLTEAAEISVSLLKEIHALAPAPGTFPCARETGLAWAGFLQPYLDPSLYEKLLSLFRTVPEDSHVLHGDFHSNNILMQEEEALLIDMDTLLQGHPIYEFSSMFLAYRGFNELEPDSCMDFFGYSADTAYQFFKKSLALYLGTEDEAAIQDLEDRCSVIGYARLMRRTIRRIGFDDPEGSALIEHCRNRLTSLCQRLDSLI